MPAARSIEKATWDDIRRGADQPPSDNSDAQPSGFHSENYTPPHTPKDYPESGSNQKHKEIGDEGKMLGYKKAGEHLMKALDTDEVLKAMDTLEKAGVFSDVGTLKESYDDSDDDAEEEASMKSDSPSPSDVAKMIDSRIERATAPLLKAMQELQAGITKMVGNQGNGAALQKVGFVPASETGKPALSKEEKASPSLKKSMDAADDDEVPDFDTLANTRMTGVLA